ncbi:hypothetical protein NG792_15765 [Laspinema sp. C3]|uniref:Uncharacterized protein n=1 Tax=Laspinema olomoucense D3b TaxID=2953688 RepID=A0ABT2N8Z3_9CYAN|nr:hypothetical protein [Laspinema sp. D3b]
MTVSGLHCTDREGQFYYLGNGDTGFTPGEFGLPLSGFSNQTADLRHLIFSGFIVRDRHSDGVGVA